jgi:hypothetical protein
MIGMCGHHPRPLKAKHPPKLFDPLDLANIQGGLHDLSKDENSWIPTFAGEIGAIGTYIGLNYVRDTSSIYQGMNILTLS